MTADEVMELSYRVLVSACAVEDEDEKLAALWIQEMLDELQELAAQDAAWLAVQLSMHAATLVRGLATVIQRTDADVVARLVAESRKSWAETSRG